MVSGLTLVLPTGCILDGFTSDGTLLSLEQEGQHDLLHFQTGMPGVLFKLPPRAV